MLVPRTTAHAVVWLGCSQMLLATFLLAAAQSVHQTYRPYRSSVLNRLETASLLTSMAVSVRMLPRVGHALPAGLTPCFTLTPTVPHVR